MITADKVHPSIGPRGIRAPKPGHDSPANPISGDHVLGMQTIARVTGPEGRGEGCGVAMRREGRAEVGRSGCARRSATVRLSQ